LAEVQEAVQHGLFRNRAFLAVWGAQILSQTAANAVTSALIILVAEITHSNTSSSFLILLAIIPAVLFGIGAGVLVDRTDRRFVLVVTNALRGVAVLPLLFFGTDVTVAYVVNFLVAAVTIFFVPAESATIPGIVRRRDLMAANSLFTFTFNGSFLLGFIILAPIAVSLYGFDFLWSLVAAMFGVSSLLCATLPASPPPQKAAHIISAELAERAFTETRQGISEAFHYLRATPLVTWAMVYIALTYTLVAVAGALAPGFVREVLKLGERNVVVIVAPAGLGVVLGLGVLNAIGGRMTRANAIGTGLMVVGLALLVLAAARPLAEVFTSRLGGVLGEVLPFFIGMVSVTALFFGVAYAFITVPAMTLLQEQLRDDIRGRVFGVLNMLVSIFSFLPLIFVGPMADLWGVAPVFVLAAMVVFAVWLGGRKVRLNSSLQ
jgi:MFS family permease